MGAHPNHFLEKHSCCSRICSTMSKYSSSIVPAMVVLGPAWFRVGIAVVAVFLFAVVDPYPFAPYGCKRDRLR
jgi:hypothetical protein